VVVVREPVGKKTRLVAAGVVAAAAILSSASSAVSASTAVQVLHSFSGGDGGSPNSIVQAADGLLYGSAATGGDVITCAPDGCGTLFKLDGAGSLTVLHVFHSSDGYNPTGLVQAKDGSFYGTTWRGGQPSGGGGGTLFRINSAGTMTILHAFVGGFACCDAAGPAAQPVQASDGRLYGTTGSGGDYRDIEHQGGFGTVYQFDPATQALRILHSFRLADGNGIFPNGPLIQASDGFLYGTTRQGGSLGGGTLFKIDTAGRFARVANIPGQPLSGVQQGSDGNFYGTAEAFGGFVYRISPTGGFTFLNRFDGADGYNPNFRVLRVGGSLYGTTPEGGLLDFQGGDLFRLDTGGALTVLHSFTTSGANGFSPNSDLIQGADGGLYGVNGWGGANGHGTIFRLGASVPGPVASVSVQPASVNAGSTSTGTVTLASPAPAGGRVVTLGAAQGQIVIPATVTVRAGKTHASFPITTLSIGATATVRIYASVTGQGVRTVVTVVAPASLSSYTIVPAGIRGGGTATGTITLTGPAPAAGAVVTLSSSSSVAILPAKVTIPAGATSVSFGIGTRPVTASTTVYTTAAYGIGTLNAMLTVDP
jgi:uncharacterized repeat protein (TIGR03803 family)